MIEKGLLEEAKNLYKNYPQSRALNTAIGYKELFKYFNNEIIKFYNAGYDVLGIGEYFNRKFIDEKTKNKFIAQYDNLYGWVRQLKVNIEVTE